MIEVALPGLEKEPAGTSSSITLPEESTAKYLVAVPVKVPEPYSSAINLPSFLI